MLRRWTTLVALVSILAVSGFAQGLSTSANKDDWEEINFEYNSLYFDVPRLSVLPSSFTW
jgi:hypothetical protein